MIDNFGDPNMQAQFCEALKTFFESTFDLLMSDAFKRRPEPLPFAVQMSDLPFFCFEKPPLDPDSRWSLVTLFIGKFVQIPYSSLLEPAFLSQLRAVVETAIAPSYEAIMRRNVELLLQTKSIPEPTDVVNYVFSSSVIEPATLSSLVSIVVPSQLPLYAEDALQEGFYRTDYHNLLATHQTSPVQMLLGRIKSNLAWSKEAMEGTKKYYHSNFMAVIQGSGSGKSRIVKEVAQSHNVVYMCLRPSASKGFPPRSTITDMFLRLPLTNIDRHQNNAEFSKFFAAMFRAISNVARKAPSVVNNRSAFWNYTVRDYHADFCASIDAAYHSPDLQPLKEELQRASLALSGGEDKNAPFVIVLDEARAMLDIKKDSTFFLHWRNWLSDLDKTVQPQLFFLLLDTSARVSNFYPTSISDDPSARTSGDELKLFQPFYQFPFLGPWPLPDDLRAILRCTEGEVTTHGDQNWPDLPYRSLENLFRFSRPMYQYSRGEGSSSTMTLHMGNVMSFAEEKVLGHSSTDGKRMILACYRYGIRPTLPKLQETLLAGHGATLTRINEGSKSLEVVYLPEPVVGEMLCVVRRREQHQWMKLDDILTTIQQALAERTVLRGMSKGDVGEMAASVYLLHAYEEATIARMSDNEDYHSFSGLLSIADWIGTLAGKPLAWRSGYSVTSYPHDCEELVRVLASWISFTGWSVANEPISPPVLSHAFCQHVGRICDTNEPAVDMVIPMVIYRKPHPGPDGSRVEPNNEPPTKRPRSAGAATAAASAANEDVASTDELKQSKRLFLPDDNYARLGAVAIQVKNYTGHIYFGTALHICQQQTARLHSTAGVSQETMLLVLCMTGAGRVQCSWVPNSDVMLFVARPETAPTAEGSPSCWVGLIVNGFSEQLLARGGGSLKKMQDFVNVGSTETTELLAECRDKDLMKLHDMVSRQMAHRLPGDFCKDDANEDEEVGQDEQPATLPKRTRTAASDDSPSIEPFEGWRSYDVIATVKRIRYIVTVYCPTGP